MKYLFSSIFLFLIALLFLSYRLWGYPGEIIRVKGKIDNYSFNIDSDGRGGKNYNYYIFLEGDSNQYKIPAKFITDFKKEDFKQNMNPGDVVDLSINKEMNLISGHHDIYALSTNSQNYLTIVQSNDKDDLEKNIAIPFFAAFFTLIGWVNFRKFKKIQSN